MGNDGGGGGENGCMQRKISISHGRGEGSTIFSGGRGDRFGPKYTVRYGTPLPGDKNNGLAHSTSIVNIMFWQVPDSRAEQLPGGQELALGAEQVPQVVQGLLIVRL